MTTHAQARGYAREAILNRYGIVADGEVKALAGVGCLETSYGDGWKGEDKPDLPNYVTAKEGNNITAIQANKGWTGLRFRYTDTHPNKDGTSTPYSVDFRAYRTRAEGWADSQRVVFEVLGRQLVRGAAAENDWNGVSRYLYQTKYYEGWGKTPEARIANHHRSLTRSIAAADNALAPHVPIVELPPVVRFGDRDFIRHGAVWQLQTELQIAADGAFGKITREALLSYKQRKSLPVNDICDAKTWEVLLNDEYTPRAA
jgi:peptidoglycan hydrolase-like protein with peptidoglycan-binding domain